MWILLKAMNILLMSNIANYDSEIHLLHVKELYDMG